MADISEPVLKILVVGEPGSTKANFINKFLYHFHSSGEVRRSNDSTHFLYLTGNECKMLLHDVNDVIKIKRSFYDEMDLVFYCYAAVDLGSLRSMEKWSDWNLEVKKEMVSSPPLTEKGVQSVLVVDVSNYGSQQNVAFRLDKMKDVLGIKRLIEISFEDEKSFSIAFQIISDEIIWPRLEEKFYA